ncbi:MAG: YbjN domain-containing protein [Phascolarctobacterium sp.]|nr:YbjN domain-containing protein [Phascolarctobacterium sp.]MBQ7883358.1 YbjN domain-containing protein [Phascolarctobacterium sp.]
MNVKATKFNEFLQANNITCFNAQAIENEMHSVLYRSFMEVNGQNLPTMVVVDDSIYVMVQVRVAAAVIKEGNRAAVMEHINKLNEKYKVFKYYINDNGDIVIESCIPSTDDDFVPGLIHAVIDVILKHLQEEYPQIMKNVWAN